MALRNLLSIEDLEVKDMERIFETATSFREVHSRDIKKVPALRARTVVNLFLEPSTRTRASFELAAKRLSADVINISEKGSSMEKGESLKDTAMTLEALKADVFVVRHSSAGACLKLSKYISSAIVNAGDGPHQHPTQALIDVFTANEFFRLQADGSGKGQGSASDASDADIAEEQKFVNYLKGKNIVIVGDIRHSRVVRSDIVAFQKFGAEVSVVGPTTLIPAEMEQYGVKVFYDLDEAVRSADVLYILRLHKEREAEKFIPSIREYTRLYGVTRERLQKNEREALLVMHPGPVNRDIEISNEVLNNLTQFDQTTIQSSGDQRSGSKVNLILEQVENGLIIRMAVLYLLTEGGRNAAA